MSYLSRFTPHVPFRHGEKGTSTDEDRPNSTEKSNYVGTYDNSPVPRLTLHSFIMGVFVSMGGFIFGYDTGQISGFLGMADFQQRFGQRDSDGDGYHFSNVRSGLIVALVSTHHIICVAVQRSKLIFSSYPLVLSWEP